MARAAENEWDDQAETIAAAAKGDMAAFRVIYDRHFDYVTRNVARLIGGSELEDVVQEVFVNIYRSIGTYRGDCAFRTWVYRVARNVTIDHLRARKIQTIELDAWRPLKADTNAWKQLEARDLLRALNAALHNVSPEHREAFFLYEVEGMKLREIAELTGDSINPIAARVRRTRERLQSLLDRKDREGERG